MSAPASIPTFLNHAQGLITSTAPVLSNLCTKCKACMDHFAAHPTVGSLMKYAKEEASNVYNHPRCKAGVISAVGSAKFIMSQNPQLTHFANGMLEEVAAIGHAAAGAAQTRAQETLFKSTLAEIVRQIREHNPQLSAEPSFTELCQFIQQHPEFASAPLGRQLVAQLAAISLGALKNRIGSLITLFSRIGGGLAARDIFLKFTNSAIASDASKKLANRVFQLTLTYLTIARVWQSYKIPGIWNKIKQGAVLGVLGILVPTYLIQFDVDFSLSMRNLLLLWHFSKGTPGPLCKALAAAMVAGGINGAVEYHPSANENNKKNKEKK